MAGTEIMDRSESGNGKKTIDFAKLIDFDDDFKISLDKSDIKLMRERAARDEKVGVNSEKR